MIALISAGVAALIVGVVLFRGVLGFGDASKAQRVTMCMIAAGIVWAGPTRYLGMAPGLGDLILMAGVAGYLLCNTNPPIRQDFPPPRD